LRNCSRLVLGRRCVEVSCATSALELGSLSAAGLFSPPGLYGLLPDTLQVVSWHVMARCTVRILTVSQNELAQEDKQCHCLIKQQVEASGILNLSTAVGCAVRRVGVQHCPQGCDLPCPFGRRFRRRQLWRRITRRIQPHGLLRSSIVA
jgi:hypothetical protein